MTSLTLNVGSWKMTSETVNHVGQTTWATRYPGVNSDEV